MLEIPYKLHSPTWWVAGILVVAVFIFVRQLSFSTDNLLGVAIAVSLLRLSPGTTAGARLFSSAMLVVACWSLVLGAVMVCQLMHTPLAWHCKAFNDVAPQAC